MSIESDMFVFYNVYLIKAEIYLWLYCYSCGTENNVHECVLMCYMVKVSVYKKRMNDNCENRSYIILEGKPLIEQSIHNVDFAIEIL